jgi:hypothetical protein
MSLRNIVDMWEKRSQKSEVLLGPGAWAETSVLQDSCRGVITKECDHKGKWFECSAYPHLKMECFIEKRRCWNQPKEKVEEVGKSRRRDTQRPNGRLQIPNSEGLVETKQMKNDNPLNCYKRNDTQDSLMKIPHHYTSLTPIYEKLTNLGSRGIPSAPMLFFLNLSCM